MTPGDASARQLLETGLAALALKRPERVTTLMLGYVDLLVRWNQHFNLTGTKDPAAIVRRHVLDSLSITPHVRGERVLDAGSGAGLPGIVLAAALPSVRVTLLDSAGKKTRFCIQAAAELGLGNVEVAHARLEDFVPEQEFSSVVSRAFVGPLELVEKSRRLLSPGGVVICMKAAYPLEDLEALQGAGHAATVATLTVPGLGEARHLLVVEP